MILERGAGSSNLLYERTAAISQGFIANGFCIATPQLICWSPPRCRRLALSTDVPEPRSFIRYQHTDGPSCSGWESRSLGAAGETKMHIYASRAFPVNLAGPAQLPDDASSGPHIWVIQAIRHLSGQPLDAFAYVLATNLGSALTFALHWANAPRNHTIQEAVTQDQRVEQHCARMGEKGHE